MFTISHTTINNQKNSNLESRKRRNFTHLDADCIRLLHSFFTARIQENEKITNKALSIESAEKFEFVFKSKGKILPSPRTLEGKFASFRKQTLEEILEKLHKGKANKGRKPNLIELTYLQEFMNSDTKFVLGKYLNNQDAVQKLGIGLTTTYTWINRFKTKTASTIANDFDNLRLNNQPLSEENKKIFFSVIRSIRSIVKNDGILKPKKTKSKSDNYAEAQYKRNRVIVGCNDQKAFKEYVLSNLGDVILLSIDTLVGGFHQGRILSVRYVNEHISYCKKLNTNDESITVSKQILKHLENLIEPLIKLYPNKRVVIKADRGKEFYDIENLRNLSKNIEIYYSNPSSPSENCWVERQNCSLRIHGILKNDNLEEMHDEFISSVTHHLNSQITKNRTKTGNEMLLELYQVSSLDELSFGSDFKKYIPYSLIANKHVKRKERIKVSNILKYHGSSALYLESLISLESLQEIRSVINCVELSDLISLRLNNNS